MTDSTGDADVQNAVKQSMATLAAARRRLSLLSVAGNIAVGLLGTYVFSHYLPEALQSYAAGPGGKLRAWTYMAVWLLVCAGALLWGHRSDAEVATWCTRLAEGTPPKDVPPRVQRRVLNQALELSAYSLFFWLLCGAVLGGGLHRSFAAFLVISGVAGLPSASLILPLADLAWRPVVRIFFPDGKVSSIDALRIPVAGRLLLAFLVVGLYPTALLAITSVSRANVLAEARVVAVDPDDRVPVTTDDGAGEETDAPQPQAVLNSLIGLQAVLVAVSALLAVVMALSMTRSVVGPLEALREAMARVAADDLDVHVPVTTGDELGYVTEVFNDMTVRLREGRAARGLLDQYVSPAVARQALEGGVDLRGRAVQCSVLFADIRDFTALSERLDPMELMRLLNTFMGDMTKAIAQHGGIVNKFAGDSLLALFGTPLNPMGSAETEACRAALVMRRKLADLNRRQRAFGRPPLGMGIGIASGQAVAGNVGGDDRIEYTVIGEPVNLASRLQELTKDLPASILMDEPTYVALPADLHAQCSPIAPVEIRGLELPVRCFALGGDA